MSTFTVEDESGQLNSLLTIGSIVLWLVVSVYAFTLAIPREQFGILFLGMALVVFVIKEASETYRESDWLHTALLAVSGVVVTATTVYMYVFFRTIYGSRVGYALDHEYALAAAFVVAMLYLVWRSFGWTFLVIVVGAIGYGYLGPYMPGLLLHGGLSSNRMLLTLVMDVGGFYGFLTRIVATWVALFLLFAGLLKGYGAFDLIFRFAVRTSKYLESGVAQTAVVASAIIGSVNGSQTANAGMTGSFTIPLMQRNGLRGQTAGGIESVASTLGQVLPPVMGAAAFIMASLLGIAYVDVLLAGIVPAAILLIATAIAVHFVAVSELDPTEDVEVIDDRLSRSELVVETVKFGLPVVVLIGTLGVLQYTVMTAALYTVLMMFATGIGFPFLKVALGFDDDDASLAGTARNSVAETVDGLREGAIVTAPVAIILAAINGVVDIFTVTGVPGILSLALFDLSGGTLILALFLSLVICIILGLGMPTTASYTLVALLIAPSLVNQFLIPDLAAHYFVFYAALLAGLTPPIATCPAVTSGIAGADFWKTCKQSIKISAPIFIIPFAFVYHPELVSTELTVNRIFLGLITLAGASLLVYGINVPLQYRNVPEFGIRLVYVVAGVLVMAYPSQLLRFAAISVAIGVYALQTLYLDDRFMKSDIVDQPPTGE